MNLSPNWLTEHLVDAEYKKYQLLAYLQEIKAEFSRKTLFPSYTELLAHFRQLSYIQKNIDTIKAHQKNLSGIDWENHRLLYTNDVKDPEVLKEVQTIIEFAYPLLDQEVKDGQSLIRSIVNAFQLSAVGITPLRLEEGYLFLQTQLDKTLFVFRYSASAVKDAGNQRSVYTIPYGEFAWSPFRSCESIKYDLIRDHKDLPNPAVYSIVSAVSIPLETTFLPIACQYFAGQVLK